jgi:hypothetical protein
MTTPEKQLNNLRRIKPDNSWKQENRSVLYNQISNSYTEEQQSLADRFREAFIGLRDSFSKPAWAVAIIAALVITGGLGVQATQYSKPGDTLYFTKKLSEKLKLALTFDEQEKVKMSIQFSSGHARDITETLSDPAFDKESAGELQNNFREEMMSVRQKLDSIAMADKEEERIGSKEGDDNNKDSEKKAEQQGQDQDKDNEDTGRQQEEQRDDRVRDEQEEESESAGSEESESSDREASDQSREGESEGETDQNNMDEEENDDSNNEGERLAQEDSSNTATDTDTSMFIMDFGKQEDGQDIYIPEQEEDEDKEGEEVHQQMEEAGQKLENNKNEVDESSLPELYELLDRAVEQFNAGNYKETKLLLEEFSEKFNNFQVEDEENESGDSDSDGNSEEGTEDGGEVKGASEEATSTDREENATTSEE